MKAAARGMITNPQLGILHIEKLLIQFLINFITRLKDGQQILQKNGHSHLIHVSDWVEEVNGWLVVRNSEGIVIKEAQKIIYPGSNGDLYCDCKQLIEQVR